MRFSFSPKVKNHLLVLSHDKAKLINIGLSSISSISKHDICELFFYKRAGKKHIVNLAQLFLSFVIVVYMSLSHIVKWHY